MNNEFPITVKITRVRQFVSYNDYLDNYQLPKGKPRLFFGVDYNNHVCQTPEEFRDAKYPVNWVRLVSASEGAEPLREGTPEQLVKESYPLGNQLIKSGTMKAPLLLHG